MYQLVNLNALSEMLDVNLRCPEHLFNMRTYVSESACGTTHCLVGNYLVYGNILTEDLCFCSLMWDWVILTLGISSDEYNFLFDHHKGQCVHACALSQKEALTRLAKFIIYKRRKKGLWENYERARRTEGDNMFCEVSENDIQELVTV